MGENKEKCAGFRDKVGRFAGISEYSLLHVGNKEEGIHVSCLETKGVFCRSIYVKWKHRVALAQIPS